MRRCFNTEGACNPHVNYMVDIQDKLAQIKKLIDIGSYFTINRARQYGKTTTLDALADYLNKEYIVLSMDFQMIGDAKFATEYTFSRSFVNHLYLLVTNPNAPVDGLDVSLMSELKHVADHSDSFALDDMFIWLSQLCATAEKPVVLMIDEVDSATNNQVFVDFLAQLRAYYLKRNKFKTFHSVILAGVYDVKNIKRKIRADEDHKTNSPWNIAADFNVDMNFSKEGIAGMLREYETDYHTGMDIEELSGLLYGYTSGYPVLVSKLCKLIDENITGTEDYPDRKDAWTKAGFLTAEKMLISENSPLFETLTGKLKDYPELKEMMASILFEGKDIPFVATNASIDMAVMFGFVKNSKNIVTISNRIFETVLSNHLLSEETLGNQMYDSALADKNQFISGGRLNMELILKKFVETFDDLYGDANEKFVEEVGRKYFMLFLKPIINGTGNCYVEARTRSMKRTDIIIDYHGEQFIVEMKIWRGPKYHEEGEEQIAEYLDFYRLNKGYLLTFNFNAKKEIGVKHITCGDRVLVEAVV